MTAKEYLSQLYKAEQFRHKLQNRINELTVKAGYGTGRSYARNYSGHSDFHCPMEAAILNQWEKEDELEKLLSSIDVLSLEIRAAINAVPDDHLRTILLMRYVEYCSWTYIAKSQGYEGNKGMRKLFRYHGDALQMVRVPQKTENTISCV